MERSSTKVHACKNRPRLPCDDDLHAGDVKPVFIGTNSNIQDCAYVGASSEFSPPVSIGNNVSVGHGAIIKGATIGDNVLVGINAVVSEGCQVQGQGGSGRRAHARTALHGTRPMHAAGRPQLRAVGARMHVEATALRARARASARPSCAAAHALAPPSVAQHMHECTRTHTPTHTHARSSPSPSSPPARTSRRTCWCPAGRCGRATRRRS